METIIVNGTKYQVSEKEGMTWPRDLTASEKIFASGVDNVYTSIKLYDRLTRGGSSALIGSAIFIIDNRNPSIPLLIETKICSITTGGGISRDSIIDGQSLTTQNSVQFGNLEQFHCWLNKVLIANTH